MGRYIFSFEPEVFSSNRVPESQCVRNQSSFFVPFKPFAERNVFIAPLILIRIFFQHDMIRISSIYNPHSIIRTQLKLSTQLLFQFSSFTFILFRFQVLAIKEFIFESSTFLCGKIQICYILRNPLKGGLMVGEVFIHFPIYLV